MSESEGGYIPEDSAIPKPDVLPGNQSPQKTSFFEQFKRKLLQKPLPNTSKNNQSDFGTQSPEEPTGFTEASVLPVMPASAIINRLRILPLDDPQAVAVSEVIRNVQTKKILSWEEYGQMDGKARSSYTRAVSDSVHTLFTLSEKQQEQGINSLETVETTGRFLFEYAINTFPTVFNDAVLLEGQESKLTKPTAYTAENIRAIIPLLGRVRERDYYKFPYHVEHAAFIAQSFKELAISYATLGKIKEAKAIREGVSFNMVDTEVTQAIAQSYFSLGNIEAGLAQFRYGRFPLSFISPTTVNLAKHIATLQDTGIKEAAQKALAKRVREDSEKKQDDPLESRLLQIQILSALHADSVPDINIPQLQGLAIPTDEEIIFHTNTSMSLSSYDDDYLGGQAYEPTSGTKYETLLAETLVEIGRLDEAHELLQNIPPERSKKSMGDIESVQEALIIKYAKNGDIASAKKVCTTFSPGVFYKEGREHIFKLYREFVAVGLYDEADSLLTIAKDTLRESRVMHEKYALQYGSNTPYTYRENIQAEERISREELVTEALKLLLAGKETEAIASITTTIQDPGYRAIALLDLLKV